MTAWLLTWVWHGVALVAAVAIALHLLPRLNAATRYAIWFGALIAIAWPGWISSPPSLEPAIYVPSAPDRAVSAFAGVWAAISLVNLVRILAGVHAVYSLRDRCRPFPRHLEARLPMWLEVRHRGRRAALKLCDAVAGPTVLGFHGPCIALPASLLAALTPAELDQIILHEYAHVQRRDDWSRLAQALALAVLWIHPAAHIVSRALQRQREMACDEWVVARTGLPKAYAQCLAHAAELRGRMRATPLLSTFLGTRHELVRRVDRLLTMPHPPRRSLSAPALCAAIAAIVILTMQLQSVRFAEIADAVLPHVAPAQVQWGQRAQQVQGGQQVQQVQQVQWGQQVQQVREVRGVRGVRQVRSDIAPHVTELALVRTALDAADAPPMSDLSARHFPGAPTASTFAPTSHIATVDKPKPNRWAAPGVEIASVAKTTSIGVANMFSRAGVSLARRF